MVDQSGKKHKPQEYLPRYQQVAAALMDDIESGRSPVGSLLKTEYELCDEFNVSRYTVREALRLLFEAGLVSRRRGAGTVVIAQKKPPIFNHAMDNIAAIVEYVRETRIEYQSTGTKLLPERLAPLYKGDPNRKWIGLEGLRYKETDPRPVCFTSLFLDSNLQGIESRVKESPESVVEILEKEFGVRYMRLEQKIEAISLEAEIAKLLKAEPGGPGLLLIRLFTDEDNEVREITESIYPADRISITMSFERGDFNFQQK